MGVKKKEAKITDDFSVSVEIMGANTRQIIIHRKDGAKAILNLDLIALDKLLRILRDAFVVLDSFSEISDDEPGVFKHAEEDL